MSEGTENLRQLFTWRLSNLRKMLTTLTPDVGALPQTASLHIIFGRHLGCSVVVHSAISVFRCSVYDLRSSWLQRLLRKRPSSGGEGHTPSHISHTWNWGNDYRQLTNEMCQWPFLQKNLYLFARSSETSPDSRCHRDLRGQRLLCCCNVKLNCHH